MDNIGTRERVKKKETKTQRDYFDVYMHASVELKARFALAHQQGKRACLFTSSFYDFAAIFIAHLVYRFVLLSQLFMC